MTQILNNIFGVRQDIVHIHFREDDKDYHFYIPDDAIFQAVKDVLLLDEYSRLKNFELVNFKNGIIVDAGAHVGTFSLIASVYANKVISVEPHPINFRLLEINKFINAIQNIVVINAALWTIDDVIDFYIDHESTGHSIIYKNGAAINVRTITLLNIIKNYEKINLLKLDIEGSEYDLLINTPDDIFNKIDNIVMELHLRYNYDLDALIKKLRHNSYNIKILEPSICDWRYSISKTANIFKRLRNIDLNFRIGLILSCIGVNTVTLAKFFDKDKYADTKILYAFKDRYIGSS